MPTYNIRGIDVDFPFEAYDCQLVYMEKVIQSLQEVSFISKVHFFLFKPQLVVCFISNFVFLGHIKIFSEVYNNVFGPI